MVGVEAQSASVTITKDGITPGVSFEPFTGPKRAVFHLTKGYSLGGETITHAWKAAGEAPGQSKSGTAGDEEMGFLQTQEVEKVQFFYAGENSSHGSMIIDIGPSLSPKTCLDTEDNVEPWTSDSRSLVNGIWKASTGDHPASRCPLSIGNISRNKPNFLFHVLDRRKYVTVLTFRLGTQFIPLRWFEWSVAHDVKFKWVGGKPKVAQQNSKITFSGVVQVGQPKGKTVQGIVKKPGRPFGNDLTRRTIQGVVVGYLTGRTANDTWFSNVPADFWTP